MAVDNRIKETLLVGITLLAIIITIFIELRSELRVLNERTARIEERIDIIQKYCCGEIDH